MAHLKGTNVNLYQLTSGSGSSAKYDVLAQASTSCEFSVTANTADGASKADTNPMWDNPIFTYCDWSCSQESFIVSAAQLNTLITKFKSGEPVVVAFNAGTAGIKKYGKAIITSMDIDAPSGDYAKLSLSLEGASALTNVETGATFNTESASSGKIKGKSLMILAKFKLGSEETASYHSIMSAKSHKLSLSAQTADTKTKDDNEYAIAKEVTGFSASLSTENLVDLLASANCGIKAADLLDATLQGETLPLKFGYFDDILNEEQKDWGDFGSDDTCICTMDAICTSWSMSNPNKEDSTLSAEFQNKGELIVASNLNVDDNPMTPVE